ncbi:unnamed protein product [Mesocestoides corti]|uniref:Cadherin domain-containing protein n=1 Tax=Mesocestoides corti TaxID=53468 RepID=A0A158QTH6_MESCO|nr:unnamed protein product [Mesocestoides corti]
MVAELIATDNDLCATPNYPPADCQYVEYHIIYSASTPRLFTINRKGVIHFNTETDFEVWKAMGSVSFTVVARNYGEFRGVNGSTRVTVEDGRPYGFFEVSAKAHRPDCRRLDDCTLQTQPLVNIKPPGLIMANSGFGTKFNIQLCLPVGIYKSSVLRFHGPFQVNTLITSCSIHIVGFTFAGSGIKMDVADLSVTRIVDGYTEVALDNLVVSETATSERCHQLDILAVVILPQLHSSLLPIDSHLDLQFASSTIQSKTAEVPIKIVENDLQSPPDFLLEDISNRSQLISGTSNTLFLAAQTLHADVINVTMQISSTVVEIKRIATTLPIGQKVVPQGRATFTDGKSTTVSLTFGIGENVLAAVPNSSLQETSIILEIDVFVPTTLEENLRFQFQVKASSGPKSDLVEKIYRIQKVFDVSINAPQHGSLADTAIQVLKISIPPSIVKSSTITFTMTSDAFFEGVYPVRARISGIDKGITVKPNCEPVLTRRRMSWNLYLQFSSTAPPRVAIDLATVIEDGEWLRSVVLEFNNSKVKPTAVGVLDFTIVSIGRFPSKGIGNFRVEITPLGFTVAEYTLECHAEVSGSKERLPSRLKFGDWSTLNSAFPNVYSNRGRCSGNTVNFGKVFSSDSNQPGNLLVAELAVLADFPKSVQGSITCLLTLDNTISQSVAANFTTTSDTSSPNQGPLNPANWTLQVLDVLRRTPINRPLRSGEVALIAFEFTVPPNTAVSASPTIHIENIGATTLDSPHVLEVGERIHWDDNYQNCAEPANVLTVGLKVCGVINSGAANWLKGIDGPLLLKGPLLVTMACYLRIDFPAKLSSANMAVNGTLGNHTVATVIKLSSSSNAYLGISPSKDDMSLSNVGPSVIETKTNGHETLRLRFCTKPGVYLDDLRLEANTESYTYEDEILNIKRLSYDAPTNYPGLHCATRKPASYRRKPNGQIWHLGISLGPVFNSGFAYWADLRKPEPDADCLALTVEVQLTGGERVEDKTMRHVVVKSIANNKVTLASRIVIVLKDHHNAFLDVNLGLMSQLSGDLRFGVTGVIRLVLKSLPNVMVKRDVNIDVGGILKCNTQDNSKPIFNPPVYFSQTARLVAAAGGNPNYLRLKPCQVRVFGAPGDFGDILLHSDATRYWTTHARGGYYKAFRSVTVLFGRVFHISDITLKLKENANNTPRSLDLDGTRDGKSFFFLRKVGVAFQSNSLETNITLTNLPGVRGLRLTLRDLLYDDEVVHIKMGFFGSLESQAQNDFDPCEAQTTSSTDGQCASSVALRSYVSGPDFIVYCDQIPDVAVDYQIRSVCFRSFDFAPTTWRGESGLDGRIAQVVSYIPKENVLLATSSCEKEYFLSADFGDSWVSIDRRHFVYWNTYPETRAMVSVSWTTVPPGFQPSSTGSSCTAFQVRQWHCESLFYTDSYLASPIVSYFS